MTDPAKLAEVPADPYRTLADFLERHDGIAGVSDIAGIAGVDDHVVRHYCRSRRVRRIGATFAFGRDAAYRALDEILGEGRLPELLPEYELQDWLGSSGDFNLTFMPHDWPIELMAVRCSVPIVLRAVLIESHLVVAAAADHPLAAERGVDALPLTPIESYVPSRPRVSFDMGHALRVKGSVPPGQRGSAIIKVELRPFRLFKQTADET